MSTFRYNIHLYFFNFVKIRFQTLNEIVVLHFWSYIRWSLRFHSVQLWMIK